MYLCERAAEGCELPQTLDAYAPGEFPPREEDETAQSSSDAARIVDVPATVRSRERDTERNATPGTPPGTLGERSCLVVSPTTKPPAPPARASYPNATKQTPFKLTPPRFDDQTPRRSNRGGGGGGGGGGTASPSNRSRTRL